MTEIAKPTLQQLLDRVGAASGPDQELDRALHAALWPIGEREVAIAGSTYLLGPGDTLPLTHSLDAALALVELKTTGRSGALLSCALDNLFIADGSYADIGKLPRLVVWALLNSLVHKEETI